MDALLQDLACSIHMLVRRPVFTLLARLIGVALLASFLPAVRASRLDPQVGLRQE